MELLNDSSDEMRWPLKPFSFSGAPRHAIIQKLVDDCLSAAAACICYSNGLRLPATGHPGPRGAAAQEAQGGVDPTAGASGPLGALRGEEAPHAGPRACDLAGADGREPLASRKPLRLGDMPCVSTIQIVHDNNIAATSFLGHTYT